MTSFTQALSALIDQQYDHAQKFHAQFPVGTPDTRDEIAAGDRNVRIGYEVFGYSGLLDEFYEETDKLDFGTFDNLREYGLTVTVGGWTFAAYEHRNSDDIILNGCPTAEVQSYGPYAADGDKHDVLFSARWKQYHEAAQAIVLAARYVLDHPSASRSDVRWAAAAAAVQAAH